MQATEFYENPDQKLQGATSRQRRSDLDALRAIAVLLLIYFHSAAIFYRGDLGKYYIHNAEPSQILSGFVFFLHQWHMPLFFLISGASSWYTLSSRSPRQYVQERAQRLLIPLVFGILVLVPPNVYLEYLSNPDYHQSYLQFYPQFFNGIRPRGNFEWAHLWFIAYLFTFSLITLPLLLHLQTPNSWLRSTLAHWAEKSGMVLLLAVPLALSEAILRPYWPGYQNLYNDWANFSLYSLYFICGYLICSDDRFEQAIDRHLGIVLGCAVVGMSILLGLWQTNLIPDRAYSLIYMLYQGFRGCNSWFWVIALFGLARRSLNDRSSLLSYATEASYPVYLLHQPVLAAIGFYTVRWNGSITAKFCIISTAALMATVALYELFVRRYSLMRVLFGLKPRPNAPQLETAQPDG